MTAFVTHDLFRDTARPLEGPATWPFTWPGNCLTAQSVVLPYPEMRELAIEKVRWRLTWNPNTGTGSQTAVRLVACYSGPVIKCEVASFFRANVTTPKNDAVDITAKVKEMVEQALADQQELQFIHQTCGDGAVGPHIYSSALEIVYR